jgi:hypothetical protein
MFGLFVAGVVDDDAIANGTLIIIVSRTCKAIIQ